MAEPDPQFLERVRIAGLDKFNVTTRPGWAQTLAQTNATPDQIALINTLVRGMDVQKRVRLIRAAGDEPSLSASDADHLAAVGGSSELPRNASAQQQVDDGGDDGGFLSDVGDFFGGIGDGIGNAAGAVGHGLLVGLDTVARVPGFLWRLNDASVFGPDDSIVGEDSGDKAERHRQMLSQGYNPDSLIDNVAWAWSGGNESFRDLDPIRREYGNDMVASAMSLYMSGYLTGRNPADQAENAIASLYARYDQANALGDEAAKDEIATQLQAAQDPKFTEVLEALNRSHVSPGRDIAHKILPDGLIMSPVFTAVSGTFDAAWSIALDPTIVGQAAYNGLRAAHYGLDAVNTDKIYHLFGEATPDGIPVPARFQRANRRDSAEWFIGQAEDWRVARDNGDVVGMAAIEASAQAAHPTWFPLWAEINGYRPAITEAEQELSRTQGYRFVDGNGVEAPYGGIRTDPITDVRGFADHIAGKWATMRLMNGFSAQERMMMPGRLGFNAERKARKAYEKVVDNLDDSNPLVIALTGRGLEDYVPDEAQTLVEKAFEARSAELFDEADGLINRARNLKRTGETVRRRMTQFLPEVKEINLHSPAQVGEIKKFAMLFLPKPEAELIATVWTHSNAAYRRVLLRGLIRGTFEAAGLYRSEIGTKFADDFLGDVLSGNRMYGRSGLDQVEDAARGAHPAGMYPNQMQDAVTIPSFTQMQQVAAFGAIAGANPEQWIKILAKHPIEGSRYFLFSSDTAEDFFRLVKLGWITSGSNMTRNLLDEAGAQAMRGGLHQIGRGSRTIRAAGLDDLKAGKVTRLTRAYRAYLPQRMQDALTHPIHTVEDLVSAVTRVKLSMVGREVTPERLEAAMRLQNHTLSDETWENLGASAVDNSVGDLATKSAGPNAQAGLASEKWELKGYGRVALDAQSLAHYSDELGVKFVAPRILPYVKPEFRDRIVLWANEREQELWENRIKELRAKGRTKQADKLEDRGPKVYTRTNKTIAERWKEAHGESPFVFRDVPDSPANAFLAYHLWQDAMEHPEILGQLDDDTIWLMQELLPSGQLRPKEFLDDLHETIPAGTVGLSADDVEWLDSGLAVLAKPNKELKFPADADKAAKAELRKQDTIARRRALIMLAHKHLDRELDGEVLKPFVDDTGRGSHGRFAEELRRQLDESPLRNDVHIRRDPPIDTPGVRARAGLERRDAEHPDVVEEMTPEDLNYVIERLPDEEDLFNVLMDPMYAPLRRESEHYNLDELGHPIDPNDTEAMEAAVRRMIPKYIQEIGETVRSGAGHIDPELASMLIRGEVPDVTDLKRIGLDNLPKDTIAPNYAAVPRKAGLNGLTKMMAGFYQHVVINPLQSIVRAPLFVDLFTTARVRANAMVEDFVTNHGWNREIAEQYADKIAEKQAFREMNKWIDNPRVTTHFEAMARNWWAFVRAQFDFIRRWGRVMTGEYDGVIGSTLNVAANARKAQLAIMAGENAGIIDMDDRGDLRLTYPGSGAITTAAANGLQHLFGDKLGVEIPRLGNLSTNLLYISPSLQNPIEYSATPMVMLPWRAISAVLPGDDWTKLRMTNWLAGSAGENKDLVSQFLPTPVGRIWQILSSKDATTTAGQVGGTVASTIVTMQLNGTLNKLISDGWSVDQIIRAVRQQSINALAVRSIFAFWAPGAPSLPTGDVTDPEGESDYLIQQAGINSLKTEFRDMLKVMDYGAALELWQRIHPDKPVYESNTTSGSPNAVVNYTDLVGAFVTNNRDFMTGRYRDVAAYFLPEAPGDFNPSTYRALLALEVRQYRDLDEFVTSVAVADGETRYFKTQDEHDQAVTEARLAGDSARVEALNQQWEDYKDDLFAEYPLLQSYLGSLGGADADRTSRINTLRSLVQDPDAPAVTDRYRDGITQMLDLYDSYVAQRQALGDSRSQLARSQRDALAVDARSGFDRIVANNPALNDLYAGTFRALID